MNKLFFLFVLLLTTLSGSERTRVMMGTYATVSTTQKAAPCIEMVFDALEAVEMVLSSYKPEADVYRLNHDGKVPVSPMLYDALLKAERYFVQSGGYFDITVGALTRGAFRFGEAERIPDAAETAGAVIGFPMIDYNATRAVLAPGMLVDFGGFGKGYGVDQGMGALKRCGADEGIIGLSGDIRCLGRCLLGIQDPFSARPLMTFRTVKHETGISTSGDYRRFVGDRTHNHLIDPNRRRSERDFASVTLIGSAANSDLDAWSTAAAVMPPQKALSFLKTVPVAYVLVYNDGTIRKSANFAEYAAIVEAEHEDH